ncbi:MAG: glucose-6-phosphate 1-dehydrogenase [Nitrospirales bacterium]|nr:MAG: glucose-6-phosphate 1-dehydrogenase [Nitrospirales bacterium]
MISRLVIFGASGDLTTRYLFPAIIRLFEAKRAPEDLSILALSRQEWKTSDYRDHVRKKLTGLPEKFTKTCIKHLMSRIQYKEISDTGNHEQISHALGSLKDPCIFYLALPPSVFSSTIEALGELNLHEKCRVMVEKPFGQDLKSAQSLNRLLRKTFSEQQIFRIDHFLGEQTVRNVLGLRFANRLFESSWNNQHIEHVEIIWDETLALEGRASYYDSSGALKDMLQNHLLQILCLIGMEAPLSFQERDFHDQKVILLRAIRQMSPSEVKRCTVRARYEAGTIDNKAIPAYKDEEGVDPTRKTETFAQVTLSIDNWRWGGVPFTLRSGKALAQDKFEVAVHFRNVPYQVFGAKTSVPPNVLRLQFNPDKIGISVNLNGSGEPFDLKEFELNAAFAKELIPAYGHLLLDAFAGDPTLFIRDDEVEEMWRIVDPIVKAWEKGQVKLQSYPAGSSGPNCEKS